MKEKKKSIRLYDIAMKAGVSVNTVSRALRNKPDVGPSTKSKIVQLADQLGYMPPAQPSNPHNQLSIGVLFQDILNPYYARIMQGIDSITWKEQANLLFGCSFRQELKEREVLSFFCDQQVDGLLIATVLNSKYVLEHLKNCPIPTVYLFRPHEQYAVDYVNNDNHFGATMVTEHLIRLKHKRIAHIAGPDGQVGAQERFQGYRDALAQAKIEFNHHLVRSCDSTMQSGYYVTKDLLQSGEKISAIFAYNDLVAFGSYKAIKEAGLAIPTDISIVGYDDIEFVEYLEFPLTTIHQPSKEIGRKAAELLFEKIRNNGRTQPQQVVLKPHLVIRGTTTICGV